MMRHVMVLAFICIATSRAVRAQSTVLVAAAGFEAPDLVAPSILLVFAPASTAASARAGRTWTVGLTGSLLSAQVFARTSRILTLFAGADAAPLRANGSSRIYRDGRRAPELEFTDGSYQGRGGLRLHAAASLSDISVIAAKESVGGSIDDTTRRFWAHPYLGVGVAESLRWVRAEDLIRARIEGVKITASAQRFFGDDTWWRAQMTIDGGASIGRLFVRGRGTAFGGRGLNIVNRFLAGGSWDADEGIPLYGFRYAAFRLDSGSIVSGRADLRVWRTFDVGVRHSELRSPDVAARGIAVAAAAIWNGYNVSVGVGVPARTAPANAAGGWFVFGAIAAGFVK